MVEDLLFEAFITPGHLYKLPDMEWEILTWPTIHYYTRHIVAVAGNDPWTVLLKVRYYSTKFRIVVLLK